LKTTSPDRETQIEFPDPYRQNKAMTTDLIMIPYHNHGLVVLSVVISILSAYAALSLVEQIRDARGRAWLAWLAGGAVVDGIGTWSMHYTGKLALRLPVPLLLDWRMVLLSLLVSIVGSGAALLVLSRGKIGWPRAVVASIFLGGIGISGLHYTAMAAIRQPGGQHYSPVSMTLSIALALVISLMAITLAFVFRNDVLGRRWRHHGSAWLRGSANPIMHYTAMAGVVFMSSGETPDLSHVVGISSIGILGISIVPVMVLVVALLTTMVGRLQKQQALLRTTGEQLRALSASLQSAREEEGIRIAREIHDELGGALTSLRWDLEDVDEVISKSTELSQHASLPKKLKAMMKLTDATVSAVRRIASEMRSSILDDLGLVEAIEWQAQEFQARTGIICQCDCSLENLDLNQEKSTAVFRILQECLTNILRHAQATSVEITTKIEAGCFVLTISDNGRGITEDEKLGSKSLGLLGMRERAQLIRAKLDFAGAKGKGTVVTVRVPLSG
jgi:signal transduction histidine kinase